MIEEWRPIDAFPRYEVSRRGEVRRVAPGGNSKPGLILKGHISPRGYKTVSLHGLGNKRSTRPIHQLVCAAFHGPRPSPRHDAAHNDGDRTNNNAANLRWATRKENIADTFIHGTINRGTRNGSNKLTEQQVREIRRIIGQGLSLAKTAESFNVSFGAVQAISSGRTWHWLS